MGGGVDHLNVLLCQSRQRVRQTGHAVRNVGVVLDVGVTVKVIGHLAEVVALHHIVQEVVHQRTVLLGLVQIRDGHGAIGLGVTGRIRCRHGGEVVPVLCDLAVFIKAEDVERHLLTGTGKVVDSLKEHLVAILKCTDVLHRGLDRSRSQILHRADKGICAGAVGEIVLDVTVCQQAAGGLGVARCKGVDESQCLFGLALLGLLGLAEQILPAEFLQEVQRGGCTGRTGKDRGSEGERGGTCNQLFHNGFSFGCCDEVLISLELSSL